MRYLVICAALAACQGTPELGTTSQASVIVSPSSVDFGSSQVGVATAPQTININPSLGNNDDTVNAITASCPDFSISAPGLPAEVYRVCETTCVSDICQTPPNLNCVTTDVQSYAWTATFKPTVAGAVSCAVTVTIDGAPRTVSLSGTGTLPPLSADIAPASMAFGQVHVGATSSPIGLSVTNTGGQPVSVSGLALPPSYASNAPSSFVVNPGGVGSYAVTCTPASTGAQGGALTFSTNDPNHANVTIPLSCTGIDGNLSISPSPGALPAARVGDPKSQLAVSLSNTGAAQLTLQSVAISGDRFSLANLPAGGSVIAPGGVANALVEYDPSVAGDATGTLTATFDGGKTVAASLTASALVASMAVTPDGEVDLGPVCVGQSKSQDFTVLANAAGPFSITALSTPDAPFSVDGLKVPAAVQGNGATTQTFHVSAAPIAPGHETAEVAITTDIPNAAPHSVALSVDALPAGITPTPDMLDFGSAPLLATTLGQTVHVSNCNAAAATWSNPRIEGTDAGEFAIVAQPDAAMIPSTMSANWLIVLQAHTAGNKDAMFSVDLDDGTTVSVPLTGEGLGDGVGTGDTTTPDKKSYYSCSAGGSAGLAPIGLALLVLRRRRRCAR